jgi:hypothetical protein
MSILNLKGCKVRKHMDIVSSVVLEKMDPHHSFGGLNSQQSTSCEPSIGSFQGRNESPFNTRGSSTYMIMTTLLLNRIILAKTTTYSMKLSTCMFH